MIPQKYWDDANVGESGSPEYIVALLSELINQEGQVVQKGEHKLMLPCRPGAAQ